jgi:uncharacterized protein (TIGR02231 family)
MITVFLLPVDGGTGLSFKIKTEGAPHRPVIYILAFFVVLEAVFVYTDSYIPVQNKPEKIMKMTLITIFYLITALAVSTASISEVTVYSDRALVSRSQEASSESGEQRVLFENIPLSTDLESLRADGFTGKGGGLKILEIKTVKNYENQVDGTRLDDLKNKLTFLQDAVTVLNSEEARLTKQKGVLDIFIGNARTGSSDDLNSGRFSLQQWKDAYQFYMMEMSSVDEAIFSTRKKRKETNDEISRIKGKLAGYKSSSSLYTLNVEVFYTLKKNSPTTITLSYIVPGTYWYPVYDTRVDLDSGKTVIEYYARVYQSSGEDWNDVKLTLSTARPDLSGTVPVITPWDITWYEYTTYRDKGKKSHGFTNKSTPDLDYYSMTESFDESEEKEISKEYQAEIKSQGVALSYGIVKRSTIPSGGNNIKVTVSTGIELTPELSWEVVPRLSESVFLKGLVTNDTEFTFLPGDMNLFVGDSFIGTSTIEMINPNQEFSLNLGRDPRIQSQFKLDNLEKGTRLKKKYEKRRYVTSIENNSGKDITIKVKDTVPRSLYPKKMVVSILMISPEQSEIEQGSIYSWDLEIAEGKTATVTSEWEIEYPQELQVEGL